MPDFYIEQIVVSGNGKKTSAVNFAPGLNIICGPSDTGKSYVIEILDYLFGSDHIPIDVKHGYDTFEMHVHTSQGKVTVRRKVIVGEKTNTAEVISSDDRIDSGDYKVKKGTPNLNEDVWLKIMGITEHHDIISTQKYKTQRLTIRSILHMILVKEENVIQRQSVLIPTYQSTAFLSSLYFMMTGEDFKGVTPHIDKAIREERKKAVIDYINERLLAIGEKRKKLEELPAIDTSEIEAKVQEIVSEISLTENQITDAVARSKKLLDEIYSVNDQITECEHLLERQNALKTQYVSDIRRLGFIVDGESHASGVPHMHRCPLCHNDLPEKEEESYVAASTVELSNLRMQLNDIAEAELSFVSDRDELNSRLSVLLGQREDIESLIKTELQPKTGTLQQALRTFQYAVELTKEASMLSDDEITLKSELFKKENEEEESETLFDIKSRMGPDIMNKIDEYLTDALKSCNFDSFGQARMEVKSAFDVIIDGKTKYSYGKGYRAFLNTIVAFTFMRYLSEHGKYTPGLLAIDSPILSLKEPGEEKASDTMKAALFHYFLEHQKCCQLIILENNIPDIDYGNTNIVQFTKDPVTGRIGLLYEP